MKVENIHDAEAFMKMIDSCKGKVELVTEEGDRLNLKSKLSQLISLERIFDMDPTLPEIELVAYDKEDVDKITHFMLNQ